MPETPESRTDAQAALIAAAATGELTGEERVEYDALVAGDPSVAAETARMRTDAERVADLGHWEEVTPDEALSARVLALGTGPGPRSAVPPGEASAPRGGRPTRALPAVAAAALLVLGGVLGAVVAVGVTDDSLPEGPPGTHGALEAIDFRGEPADVDIEASLIAHTWGTETVLDMDGWEPGEEYRLVLVGTDGVVEESGTFLGSEVVIECRMNAALLREDVDQVEIRDADDQVVATSDVPDVTT